ncbi:hypothetical protein CK203_110046 [Vitis vinifera]|uniref:Uncharacterized protein n=1 Tax=Vitis vinifera TaxID=29760 RepID=A0A438DC76_VITVI|nr:hypothetical protein CK203_110046 [Vitis vinifera]
MAIQQRHASFPVLVERLIKAGHLKQYLRSDNGGRTHPNITTRAPRAPAAPKAVINYINGGPSDEEYDSRRKDKNYGTIIFPPVDPTRTLQPHRDALILSLEIGDFDVRRILVDPGSSADLVQASVVGHMGHSLTGLENPGRILSGFNGLQLHPWETLYCRSKLAQSLSTYNFSSTELSPFNIIWGAHGSTT